MQKRGDKARVNSSLEVCVANCYILIKDRATIGDRATVYKSILDSHQGWIHNGVVVGLYKFQAYSQSCSSLSARSSKLVVRGCNLLKISPAALLQVVSVFFMYSRLHRVVSSSFGVLKVGR